MQHQVHTRRKTLSDERLWNRDNRVQQAFLQTVSGAQALRFWWCTTFPKSELLSVLHERKSALSWECTESGVGISWVTLEESGLPGVHLEEGIYCLPKDKRSASTSKQLFIGRA